MLNDVIWPLSNHVLILPEPGIVPMAIQYLAIPLSGSLEAAQFAVRVVDEYVKEMSAPLPSRTTAGAVGGVISPVSIAITYCPFEFTGRLARLLLFTAFTLK